MTAKERILKEYTRLAAAIENAKEGILIQDRERTILYANTSFLRTSGYTKEELIGKKASMLRSDQYNEQFHTDIIKVISQGKEWRGIYRRQRKDKTYYDVDMTINPLQDRQGNISEYVIVERDITDDLKLQQRIRQLQKMEALGNLAAGVAHDFNNILMPIIVNTEMALWDVPKDSATYAYLKLSLEAAEKGRELVKQIVAFSRPSYQEKKPIKIGPVIEEALHLMKSTLPSRIRITQNIEAKYGTVLADPSQIHQVLINLFSNAAHAMGAKRGELKVELRNVLLDIEELVKYPELKPGNYLKLTVSDTGCGMSEEVMENIFDPFFTTKNRGKGAGMGLSVVHSIIKNHGGVIDVHSELGKGTTFNILLPLIEKDSIEERSTGQQVPRGNERILLVDDEEAVLNSFQRVLTRLGYDVIGKKDGAKALKAFRARPKAFDLVITDQIMSGLSGTELARKILDIRPNIPIMLCTGFSNKINRQKLRRMGIRELILKPFTTGEIAQTIRRILDQR